MQISRRQMRYVAIGLAALLFIFLADWLIVTDREQVEGTLGDIMSALQRADVSGLFGHVAPDYHDQTFSRAELRMLAEAFVMRYGAVSARLSRAQVRVAGGTAAAVITVVARTPDSATQTFWGASVWEIAFRKTAAATWSVTSISPVRIGRNDVNGWSDVVGIGRLERAINGGRQ